MTIRYTCADCQSVLKIKDEKAGTNAKCPKCKTPFVVPQPGEEEDGIEVEEHVPTQPAIATAPELPDMVDMPIELTPEVAPSDDFDPMDVLAGASSSPGLSKPATTSSASTPTLRKPSMAELMKDLEAAKKKEARKSAELNRPAAASAAQTSGSAADMLSRAYQQKRDSASAPPVNAKDAKAAEEKAMLVEFLRKRALPAILVIGSVVTAYYFWMNQVEHIGPPLYTATGVVTMNGTPAAGIEIRFEPLPSGPADSRDTYVGTTDETGYFELMYTAELTGAADGEYMVGFSKDGKPLSHPNGALKLTVKPDNSNEYKIDL